MNIGIVQSQYTNGNKQKNLEKMVEQVKSCKNKYQNVEIIVFPELCSTGYFLTRELQDVADHKDGEHFQILSEVAKKEEITIAYGYVEKGDTNIIYNSLMVINSKGEKIANYRKIHLTPLEKEFFTAGSEIVVVESKIGSIGLMTCWDLAFPDLTKALAQKGAEVILAPSAWESPYDEPYELFARARAIDYTVYLATCNHIGLSNDLDFFGKSAIYGPDGKVIIKSKEKEEAILFASLDLTQRKKLQKSFFTMQADFREDLFKR
jgi:5-aminopentanamidase